MNKCIKFYTMDKDNPIDVFKDHQNHILIYEKGEIFFNPEYGVSQDIEISHITLELNEELSTYLFSVYMIGLENAKKLCDEPIIYTEYQLSRVRAAIDSTINLYMLREDQGVKNSIWDFLIDIFIKLLMFHCLENGNKRTAFSFLMLSLSRFGYHLIIDNETNSNCEMVLVDFVGNLGQNTHDNEVSDEIKGKITNWIKTHVVINPYLIQDIKGGNYENHN